MEKFMTLQELTTIATTITDIITPVSTVDGIIYHADTRYISDRLVAAGIPAAIIPPPTTNNDGQYLQVKSALVHILASATPSNVRAFVATVAMDIIMDNDFCKCDNLEIALNILLAAHIVPPIASTWRGKVDTLKDVDMDNLADQLIAYTTAVITEEGVYAAISA